ncbi:calcyclin-binding protein-like isoform X2 [Stegodyphus dumicola]|uniref:calcyclin-binding protein-like isoform X2 n=1 Tax=Stegodyphus dumicola TaxID=202533 RepID=UPI0015B1367C|nr:calcyclin-binding protein-like isoform X2 [Stegodyphus dumicola]
MSAAENFRRDAEELFRLSQLTQIENVQRILHNEAEKLKQLADLEEKSSQGAESRSARPVTYTCKIINYAWDQSDKFLKIYVTLNGVHNFPKENVTVEFGPKSFELQALGLDKKNNVLTIKNLLHEIIPSKSYYKVKTDMVVLYLKKKSSDNWTYVTESEKKSKEHKAPKYNKDEDPSQSLMNLMKQMYEDGDDDMKRTIAKAWTEARDKKSPDEIL